ncbi:MAG TPA: helix-turn-helix domain-containing protein [Candidatus Nanoarchaeia archaeon]|nr:helix-turn-helix domain-containing protein [Candidatus Nanoarchaeia archaeon]
MVLVENVNKSLLQIFRELTGYEGTATTRLYLGELAFGTRLYDERIAEGLNTYLRQNGYEAEIDSLVIGGGLFPEFPPLYSVTNAERMRMLGTDSKKEGTPATARIEQILEHVLGEKEAARFSEYRQKWLEQKINTWDDCKQFSRHQLETLLDGLEIGHIDYCMGEEDKFNQRYEEELKVNRLAKEARKYLKGRKETLEEEEKKEEQYAKQARSLEEHNNRSQQEYKVLTALNPRVRSHLKSQSPNIAQFLQGILQEEADTLLQSLDTKGQREELLRRLRDARDEVSFTRLYDDKRQAADRSSEELKALRKEAAKLKKHITSLEEDVDSLERQIEQGDAITIFTKRSHISPIEAEWIYKDVKDKYTEDILGAFPAALREKITTHISGSAKVQSLAFGDGKDDVMEEAEVVQYGDILVIHNTRFRSTATTLYGLSDAQREILWRKVLEKVTYETEHLVPKTIVAVHGSGGFAVTRMNSAPEFKLLDGSYRQDPEVTTVMTLPVFQSTDNLVRFYDKHMNKTWGTKRFAQHVHGAGAVLQTVLEDGSELYEFIDTASLLRIADQKREVAKAEKGSAAYTAAEEQLRLLCSKTLKLRATLGDAHFGAANFPGTPTNYERTARTLNYLEERYAGKLDDIILTELPDGVLPHTGTDRKFFGKPLPQLRREAAEYLRAQNLKAAVPPEELAKIIDHIVGEFSAALAQNAVPNLERQYEIIRPYIEELVAKIAPQRAILISGNHPRSQEGADESSRLADIVRAADRERKVTLLLSDGIGHKFGGQGGIADEEVIFAGEKRRTGKSLGFYHEPQGGKNAMPRTLDQLLAKGVGFDEYFAGHIHQGYAAYANGTAITINPPLQGPNDYSEHLLVKPSLYGPIVKLSNVAPEGHPANDIIWHAWHFINDNTLERPDFRYDRLEQVLQTLGADGRQGKLLEQWKTLDKAGQSARLEEMLKGAGGNVTRAAQQQGIGKNFLYERMAELGIDPKSFRSQTSPLERGEIEEALQKTKGNVTQAAALLNVKRTKLYRSLKRLGMAVGEGQKEAAAAPEEAIKEEASGKEGSP